VIRFSPYQHESEIAYIKNLDLSGGCVASYSIYAKTIVQVWRAKALIYSKIWQLIVEGSARMSQFQLNKAFTLLESGPVILVTTHDGKRQNVMTISWTMVMDFTPRFAITTGPWNYSYTALRKSKECVIALPTVDLIDKVIGVGTCSGIDTDKFERFGLTSIAGQFVRAPLIKECLANIECHVVDIVKNYNIIVLEGVAVHFDNLRNEKRTIHAVGDGTFIVDGEKINRREMMLSRLPPGV
jgi:flavin reductase (DIM6/NTAB) family NADH-FMN oxidoreductase RutF